MFARFALIPFIFLAGALSAYPAVQAQAVGPSPQTAEAQRPTDMMMVKGRLHIETPSGPLRLGVANAIDLRVEGPALLRLSAEETHEDVMVQGGQEDLTLQKRPDGGTYVVVQPVAPGQAGLVFFAVFADGGYERDDVQVEVNPAGPPEKLEIAGPGIIGNVIRLNLLPQSRKARVALRARYAGLAQPVIYQMSAAQTDVRFDPGEHAIRFDAATGTIEALRVGHALLTARLDGVAGSVCVAVEETQFYQQADCSELEPGGSGVPAIARGADAPGVLLGSRLPYTANDRRTGRFIADDRVTITPPAGGLELAKEAEFTLEVLGPAIARVECTQTGSGSCTRWMGERPGMHPEPDVPWNLAADGRGTVSVFPSSLVGPSYKGSPEFSFLIYFVDGGVAAKTVTANVAIGSVPARPCPAGGQDANEPIRLAAPENGAKTFPNDSPISDFACYDGIRGAVLVSPQFLKYAVESEGEQPVVQLDASTGKVTAVGPGEALVIEKAAGQQWAQCVIVAPRHQSHDLSNCRNLRRKYGAPLPPVEAQVEPAHVIVTEEDAAAQDARARMGVMGRIAVPGPPGALPQLSAITYGTLSPEARDRFAADDRLEVSVRGVHAELGRVARVPIQLHGPEPLALGITQERTLRYQDAPPRTIEEAGWEEEQGAGTIYRETDGSLAIHVTPLRPERAKFTVEVLFADGGVATRTVEVAVALPAPATVHLQNALENVRAYVPTIPATTLHLSPGKERVLFPTVSLDGGRRPIALEPGDVTFAVKQAADPVIGLDGAAGTVTALRIGHALVQTRFDGTEADTCVVVEKSATPGDPSNCEELRK